MKKNLNDNEVSKVVGGDMTFEKIPEPREDAPNAGWLKVYIDGVYTETLHYLDESECEMLQDSWLTSYYETHMNDMP